MIHDSAIKKSSLATQPGGFFHVLSNPRIPGQGFFSIYKRQTKNILVLSKNILEIIWNCG